MQAVRGYVAKRSVDEHVEVFSFLFRHPFGFFGKYSPDMLEHHTRLNLDLLLLLLFFGFHFFSCWNSGYLCPIMELQESMP